MTAWRTDMLLIRVYLVCQAQRGTFISCLLLTCTVPLRKSTAATNQLVKASANSIGWIIHRSYHLFVQMVWVWGWVPVSQQHLGLGSGGACLCSSVLRSPFFPGGSTLKVQAESLANDLTEVEGQDCLLNRFLGLMAFALRIIWTKHYWGLINSESGK